MRRPGAGRALNDIGFDEEISRSMAKVVASSNLKAAAENEGQALVITKTKQAEAEGNAIKIAAEAELQAAQLRGQGVALFRQEVAKGMTEAAHEMQNADMDVSVILFTMWTDALKHFAENGKGNIIFLDGSTNSMETTMKHMMGLSQGQQNNVPQRPGSATGGCPGSWNLSSRRTWGAATCCAASPG